MSLENITRYESAAVAGANLKERPNVAFTAIDNFYHQINLSEDPIIARALEEGAQSIAGGYGIGNIGLIKAAQIYGRKYADAFVSTSVSDLLGYLGEGYEIPQTVNQALAQYANVNFGDLQDESAKVAIGLLQKRRLDNIGLSMKITANDQGTIYTLNQLYPEQENQNNSPKFTSN
jgi:hypothetical protein